MLLPDAVDNERDKGGDPICPVCHEGFHRAVSMLLVGGYMVHLSCVHEARRRVGRGALEVVQSAVPQQQSTGPRELLEKVRALLRRTA